MAKCDFCNSNILFGGVQDGNLRFCNQTCNQKSMMVSVAQEIPEEMFDQHLASVHQGNCPKCRGPGPVDVHTSHTIWSVVFMTSWHSKPQVCCRSCGVKAKLGGAALSGVVGWWGFPWGIIGTPIQIGRNLFGIFSEPDPARPSEPLAAMVRLDLAQQIMQRGQQVNAAPSNAQAAKPPQPHFPES